MSPPSPIAADLVQEGQRMASICNACRYCEGYCAVFPALERRLVLQRGRPRISRQPVPRLRRMLLRLPVRAAARVPAQSAEDDERNPRRYLSQVCMARDIFTALFERNGMVVSVITSRMHRALSAGHGDLCRSAGAVLRAYGQRRRLLCRAVAPCDGAHFWRCIRTGPGHAAGRCRALLARHRGGTGKHFSVAGPLGQSIDAVLRLTYLRGGGDGCTYSDDRPSPARRAYHQITFYGFLALFRRHVRGHGLSLRLRTVTRRTLGGACPRCSAPSAASPC